MSAEPRQSDIEAAVFRKLISHLQTHTDVQNMDLMLLARFCRNCLAKWYQQAAEEQGKPIEYQEALAHIYGMPYDQWKQLYQKPATPEQMAQFKAMNPD